MINNINNKNNTPCTDIAGFWTNELKSCMYLKYLDSYKIVGHYKSLVGGSSGYHDLEGFVNSSTTPALITFSVNFDDADSLVAWVGQCVIKDDRAELHTQFHRVTSDVEWKSITTNSNTFSRDVENICGNDVLENDLCHNIENIQGNDGYLFC